MKKTFANLLLLLLAAALISCTGGKAPVDAEKITLDRTEITIAPGASETIKATIEPEDATDKTIVWTSSSDSVTVDNGTIKASASAAGECTITASSRSNPEVTATCKVTIAAAGGGSGGTGGGRCS